MSYADQIHEAYPLASLELAEILVSIAKDIDADPGLLADLIWYESAQTFSPSVRNPKPGSTATGLIQFIEATAEDLGTSTAYLASLSAEEQADVWVRKYLTRVYDSRGSLAVESDLYMAVFYPKAIGQGIDYAFGPAVTGTSPDGTPWNRSTTTRDYRDYVRSTSNLGPLLSSSSSSSSSSSKPVAVGAVLVVLALAAFALSR